MFLLRHNITINFNLKYDTFGITERTNCIETQVKNYIILLILRNSTNIRNFKFYLIQRIKVENTFILQMIELPNSTENGGI